MFTIPAIHHSSVKLEDESAGTMHLNALNGSSNVLGGPNRPDSSIKKAHNSVFGGLIGASVSENHPYMPHDSGRTFHETSQFLYRKSTNSSSTLTAQNKSSSPFSLNFNSKRKDSASSLGTPETNVPACPRRRSLDLDLVSTNGHRRYEDRSLSLDELVIGPFSRFGRFLDDAIDEHELNSDQDISGLSITEISINNGPAHVADSLTTCNEAKTNKKKKKKTRAPTTDSTMSERALRLVDKIKDNGKDHNSNFQLGQHISKDNRQECHPYSSDSYKIDNFQHIFHHLLTPSGQLQLKPDGH